MFDGQAFGREIVEAVNAHSAAAERRIAALESITQTQAERIDALEAANKRLEARVAELQSKGVEYKGVWQRACAYERGAIVTEKNSLWVCIQDVGPNARPSEASEWQLACRGPA